MNIVNDKISSINGILELINDLMGGINVNTSNDIAIEKLKNFKSQLRTLINSFNLYIKEDTKNNTEPDTKNKTESDTKNKTKSDTKNNIEPDTKNKTEPDTKNNTKSDTKNNTKPYTKDDIESNFNDIRAFIRKNEIKIKKHIKVY